MRDVDVGVFLEGANVVDHLLVWHVFPEAVWVSDLPLGPAVFANRVIVAPYLVYTPEVLFFFCL